MEIKIQSIKKDKAISILILNYNGISDTIECIKSLNKISTPEFNIIVVDNGSKENEAKIIKSMFSSVITIRSDKNLGFAGGNNLGINYILKHLFSEYILLLNNDTIVRPDFLSSLLTAIKKDEKIGVVQPKIYYYLSGYENIIWSAGGKIEWWKGNVYGRGAKERDKGQYDNGTNLDWATGCAMLIKSSVFQDVGLFNENFFLYWEDTEWSQRVIKAGYKIMFVPEAVVYHKSSISANKYLKHIRTFFYVRNSIIFFKSSTPSYVFPVAFLMYFLKKILFSLFVTFIKRKWDHFFAILSGINSGLMMKMDKRQE